MAVIQIKSGLMLLLIPTVNRLLAEATANGKIRQMAAYESLFVSVQLPNYENEGYLIHLGITNVRNVKYCIATEKLNAIRRSVDSRMDQFIETIETGEWNGPTYLYTTHSKNETHFLSWSINTDDEESPDNLYYNTMKRFSVVDYKHSPLYSGRTYYIDPYSIMSQVVSHDQVMADIAEKHRKLNPLVLPGFDKPNRNASPKHHHTNDNRIIGSSDNRSEGPIASKLYWDSILNSIFDLVRNGASEDILVGGCQTVMINYDRDDRISWNPRHEFPSGTTVEVIHEGSDEGENCLVRFLSNTVAGVKVDIYLDYVDKGPKLTKLEAWMNDLDSSLTITPLLMYSWNGDSEGTNKAGKEITE